MKKLLKVFSLCFLFSVSLLGISSANDCISRTLGNNSVCISINKESSNRYTLDNNINCRDTSCAVSCSILLPDNTYTSVGACNGTFRYSSSSSEKVKLYITVNNEFSTIEGYYNFRNGSWGDISDYDDDDDYSNNELSISTNNKKPSVSEYIRLTIDTDSDYVGNVSFYKVQYKSSNSSSWNTISRTDSTYFSSYSDERDQGYYKMKSSDRGYKVISNFLKFSKKGYYRIYAKDVDGNSDYIDFEVGGSSSYSNDEVEISTNDRYPSTSEYVDLILETDRNYDGKIYLTAKYKSSNSSSWTTVSNKSSTYFSSISSARSNGYVYIYSSNNGYKKISDSFKFVKKGYYRIYAEDEYGNSDYIDFEVDGSSSYSNDEVEISTNDRYPSTSEYVDLILETDRNYDGKIYLTAKYKSSSSSSWTTVSNKSSTYFSSISSARSNGYVYIYSSNNGYKKISDSFKFVKKGYYRIYAEDEYGNSDYIDFEVGEQTASYNDLEISTSNTSPNVGSYISLTIDTDSNYIGNVSFYKVQYRSSNSDTRTNISRTSSTYFQNYSNEWEDGYYRMKSSDNGHKVISNFIKFAKKGYYRIYAKDTDGNEDYIDLHVYESTYYNDDLYLNTNDSTPRVSDYVDLIITTDSSYRGKVNFTAKYRESTSATRVNVSRTSSNYFLDRSTTRRNGYVTMTSSDNGRKTVSDAFKFAKKGYYRITAEDENGNSTYIDFNVGYSSSSPLNGFTQKEFEMIERIYNTWPTLIRKLKNEYPRLRNNSTWNDLSDELYDNMGDVVNKRSNREFKDYDDFDRAFRYRFTRTQNLMD